jgi:hypothetical protein
MIAQSGWNLSLIDPGPNQAGISVPIYGTPTVDPITKALVPVIASFEAGVHINAAPSVLSATPAAAQYVVSPASPVCVWAGNVPTVFFKFPDQATAQSVLAAYWTDSAKVV